MRTRTSALPARAPLCRIAAEVKGIMDDTTIYILSTAVVFVFGGIGMWLRKRYLKKVMEKGLGRKVEDRELTSISEWMDALPDERPQGPRRPRT
jgi:hypothetical protein